MSNLLYRYLQATIVGIEANIARVISQPLTKAITIPEIPIPITLKINGILCPIAC